VPSFSFCYIRRIPQLSRRSAFIDFILLPIVDNNCVYVLQL
jgi:hypothetical protein